MEKNKSKLRTKLIRKIRNDLGWSIENISTGIGISLSIMSDIERGKRNLSDKNFEQIIKYLNIEYKYLSNEDIIKWQNLIDDLVDSFYYIDDEKIEFLIKKIDEFEIDGRYSDVYYYQSVMKLAQLAKISGITQYGDNDYEVKKIYTNIQSVRELLPVNVVAAADYFYALYLLNIRRLMDSEKILNDNFLPGSDRTGQKLVILFNFLTIRICFRKKGFIRPLNIISEVKPKLEIDRNFSRILSLNHFQAYFYMALYRFEEALELYQELVPFLYSMHRETLLKQTKENIIWCHLMLENYEEAAIAMSDLEFEIGLNPASNVLYRILCLIQLNTMDEA